MSTPTSTFVTTTRFTTDPAFAATGSTTTDSWDEDSTTTSPPPITTLTTPFVQASDCISIWDITYESPPAITENTDNTLQATCRPSGWVLTAASPRALSPAVCPESWTYYGISAWDMRGGATTATCCPSGYMPADEYKYLNQGGNGDCTSWTKPHKGNPPLTATLTENSTTLFSSGAVVRMGWTISWAPTDVDKLSPRPPPVSTDYGVVIPTWVPGGKVKQVTLRERNDGGNLGKGIETLVLAIVLPVLAIAACCCGFCCCQRRKKRKAKQAARQAEIDEWEMERAGTETQDGNQVPARTDGEGTETPAPRYSLDGAQDPAPPYEAPPSKAPNLAAGPGPS